MTTVLEAAKEEVKKATGKDISDDTAEYVLWEHTGYPSFWSISETNPTPEACLRSQVREWALANVRRPEAASSP